MGLKEIADQCGFDSADSMRRVFLRVSVGSLWASTQAASKAQQFEHPEIITGETKSSRTCSEASYLFDSRMQHRLRCLS
jgi:hypothetical protein